MPIDVPAHLLNVTAQLAPLIRAHASAVGFRRRATVALGWGTVWCALRRGLDALTLALTLDERLRRRRRRS